MDIDIEQLRRGIRVAAVFDAADVCEPLPDFCAECEADPNVPPAHSTLFDGKLHGHGVCLNCGRAISDSIEEARKGDEN